MKVSFPHMGNYHIAFKSLFEKLGCEVLLPPPISKRTIELGVRHSPEFVCFPFKVNLGNYIEALELGADVLFQAGRTGSCRYSFYGEIQSKILEDMGYKFKLLKFFSRDKGILSIFAKMRGINQDLTNVHILKAFHFAFKKMRLIDEMEHRVRKLRAYELQRGDADKILKEGLKLVNEASNDFKLREVRRKILESFERIKVNEGREPIKVGIVGELYVVMEPFVNLNMERRLGDLGVEVYRPLCLTELILHALLPWQANRILRKGKDFIQFDLGAHAGQAVGHAVEFATNGFDGIIQLYPFTCMPEVSGRAVLSKVSQRLGIPILYFSLDELSGETGVQTRVEAFVDMLERRRKL